MSVKPAASQTTSSEWAGLLEVYSRAAKLGELLSIEVLWASAVRSMIIVHAENREDLSRAEEIAAAALRKEGLSSSNRFLIEDILGRQYVYGKQKDLAKHWLTRSLQSPATAHPEIRAFTHLELASVYGDENPGKAVAEVEKSIQLCRDNATLVGEAQLIRSLGELGIARWSNGDIPGCFDAFEEATTRTLDGDFDEDERDGLIARVGHCLGFFSSVAATGQPPSHVKGDKAYTPPIRREFLGHNKELLEWYRGQDQPDRGASLCACIAAYAEAVGRDDLATLWATRGIDEARALGNLAILGQLGQQAFLGYLKKDSYATAIDIVRESALAMRASKVLVDRGGTAMMAHQSAEGLLGESDESVSREAELWAIHSGAIPLLLHIGRIAAKDSEEAKDHAAEVVDSIKAIAQHTHYADAWNAVGHFVEGSLVIHEDWQELKRSAEDWGSKSRELQTLGYLATTLSPDVPLGLAASGHVLIAWYVVTSLSPTGSVRRCFLEEFLIDFWQNTFTEQRFRFVGPNLFDIEFQAALSGPPEKRLSTILRGVLRGSGASSKALHPDALQWLNEL